MPQFLLRTGIQQFSPQAAQAPLTQFGLGPGMGFAETTPPPLLGDGTDGDRSEGMREILEMIRQWREGMGGDRFGRMGLLEDVFSGGFNFNPAELAALRPGLSGNQPAGQPTSMPLPFNPGGGIRPPGFPTQPSSPFGFKTPSQPGILPWPSIQPSGFNPFDSRQGFGGGF